MADLSSITLPNNATYDLKDAVAREYITRSCNATLSSVGWYRAMCLNATTTADALANDSFVITFTITQTNVNANNCLHIVKLLGVYNNIAFVDETSRSNTDNISQIRYTHNSSGKGYVDIYYSGSSQNDVSVCFDVRCGDGTIDFFQAESLQSVGDSPSGETIDAQYSFYDTCSHVIILHGTGSPSGGHSGDVYIKHS